MSRSGIPPVVFLEMSHAATPDIPAVLGTDSIVHIDGRLSRANALALIRARADRINAYRGETMHLLGYSLPRRYGGGSDKIYQVKGE